ncbi:MAG: alkaline phosphatase family protein [Candidatus Brocadiia bacterium]
MAERKLAVVGFDSISLPTLLQFVERGVMPNVKRLIEQGSTTQTWPCFPMETGTNWACLSTGASPQVTGCNMRTHFPGRPLDEWQRGFPASVCKAEHLWGAARRAGKRSVVFDWAHSWPPTVEDGLIHVGEDGRPDNAMRALQEARAYSTHPRSLDDYRVQSHVTPIEPRPARDWAEAPAGSLEFGVTIQPGPESRYENVEPLHALLPKGPDGFERIELYADPRDGEPLMALEPGRMSNWVYHTFRTDRGEVRAAVRGKLLILEPDASRVHLYLSEIYPLEGFVHPLELTDELLEACGPFIIQCSRQQVVQAGACDIATYFEEQRYLARWWRDAASYILGSRDWDLFMLKWHGPDWTNHLTMYMIDSRHPMHEPDRAEEGWALWDRIMGWGDEIVGRVVEAAGPDALIALVSDHGGDTQLPLKHPHPDLNDVLRENGWLVDTPDGGFDWSRSVAYGRGHYVLLNVKGRDPDGIVQPGAEYEALRREIMAALSAVTNDAGKPTYRAVLPREKAGRLGVGGDRVGDIFLWPAEPGPEDYMSRKEFWEEFTKEETGTWDWPLLNAGSHSDDSYFILAGPGVRSGYRRGRPTLNTSVVPTLATAAGIPVPRDADGSVLRDFFE